MSGRRLLGGLHLGVFVLPALLLAVHRIDSPDIWFHLATGERIVHGHALPYRDPFSALPPTAPSINVEWLSDVVLYALHALGGAPALVLMTALLAGAALALPLVWARRSGARPGWPWGWVLLLGTAIAYERFFTGPEMFSVLFACVWVQMLSHRRPRSLLGFLGLFLAQAAWANLHGAFVLGPLLAFLALLADLGERIRHRKAQPASAGPRPLWLPLVLPFALLLACCITPYGPDALLHLLRAWRTLGSPAFRTGIAEWQPTFAGPIVGDWILMCFAAGLAWLALALLAGRRHLRAFELLAALAFGALAFTSRRHLLLFAVTVLPLAAGWISRALRPACDRREVSRARAALQTAPSALTTAVALLMAWDVARGGWYQRFGPPRQLGWGVSAVDHPIGAADFVAQHGLEGPLFNNVAAGSYLIWRLHGRLPVFVDGRLLDPEHFRLYRTLLGSMPDFDRYADAQALRLVVLALQPTPPLQLFRHLYASASWTLLYFDGEGAVFARAEASEAQPFLQTVALEAPLPPAAAPEAGAWRWRVCDPGEPFVRGSMLLRLGFPQAARADLTQALLRCTARWDVGLELSTALLEVGRSREALPLVERALRHDPAHSGAWVNLGLCYAAAGDLEQARDCWQRALAVQPPDPRAARLLQRGTFAPAPPSPRPDSTAGAP